MYEEQKEGLFVSLFNSNALEAINVSFNNHVLFFNVITTGYFELNIYRRIKFDGMDVFLGV